MMETAPAAPAPQDPVKGPVITIELHPLAETPAAHAPHEPVRGEAKQEPVVVKPAGPAIVIEEDDEKEICIRCAHVAGIGTGGAWGQVDIEPAGDPAGAHRHVTLTFPADAPAEQVSRAKKFFSDRVNEWGEGHNHPVWVSRKNATDAALTFEARLIAIGALHDGDPKFADVRKRIEAMAKAAWAEVNAKGGPA